jgi:hypothetical protein
MRNIHLNVDEILRLGSILFVDAAGRTRVHTDRLIRRLTLWVLVHGYSSFRHE